MRYRHILLLSFLCAFGIATSGLGQPVLPEPRVDKGPAPAGTGSLSGVTRDPAGQPLPAVAIVVSGVDDGSNRIVTSDSTGTFALRDLPPGRYRLKAGKDGFVSAPDTSIDLARNQQATVTLTLSTRGALPAAASAATQQGFTRRFLQAYADDWRGTASGGPAPKYRGYPAPESNPPYPFSTWPMGGTPAIGYPGATAYPLTTALETGKHGEWWKKANIQIYGWLDVGANLSTSHDGPYANAPAAYDQVANHVTLDQATLYIERVPDTVQKDHIDWGFRLTNLYGFDYRFTTASGYFSQQLLNRPQANGTIGNKMGYDPVMAYFDLYIPQVADGMDIRIGRYISLPDIEAQLAPNNYTYTHSLTYTYDCYTQTGINATIKLNNHWTLQAGLSGGCEAAPWSRYAKLTGNFCVAYTWATGGDEVYVCANSLNDGRYSYNNLAAYYATWYHKFNNTKWHMGWETWYQYESHTPNIVNPGAASLVITNANGAYCSSPSDLTCFAPEWATVHYTNRQFGKHDFLCFRNEFFDDTKGQRTGVQTKYSEHAISWNHWIGSTILMRPEVRYDYAYNAPAYDSGHKKGQFMLAGDLIWFY